jgi:hypothetical protein
MMEILTTNLKQIDLIKDYLQKQTGLPYDSISEEERNRLSMEWVRRHAGGFRQQLLACPEKYQDEGGK